MFIEEGKRAVFLDRDGVINEVVFHNSEKPSSPRNYRQFNIIGGVKESLDNLVQLGYLLFIVTNQPDISRGLIRNGTTEQINSHIGNNLPITDIYVCPHDDQHNCDCRKPKIGMLTGLANKWDINLKKSYMIGDNWKDIEAGKSAGCKTILIDYPYNKLVNADNRVEDLESAVKLIESEK